METARQVDRLFVLLIDLLSARALVWLASVGRDADLTPEAHWYFFDRYSRLAACYRARGRFDKAKRLQAKAAWHAHGLDGDDGPPYAAAMAMPRPLPFVHTDAVSRTRIERPDDSA